MVFMDYFSGLMYIQLQKMLHHFRLSMPKRPLKHNITSADIWYIIVMIMALQILPFYLMFLQRICQFSFVTSILTSKMTWHRRLSMIFKSKCKSQSCMLLQGGQCTQYCMSCKQHSPGQFGRKI